MPKKSTTAKSTTAKKKVATKSATKKTATKKVQAKKTELKNTNVKKAVAPKVETKKVETVKVAKKIERDKKSKGFFKNVLSKVKNLGSMIASGTKKLYNKIIENVPFAITLCICILLLLCLIFVKRTPKTKDGNQIVATINGKTITADDLYLNLKDDYGTNALINLIDDYIANKEATVTDEDKDYVQQIVDYYKQYAESYSLDLATFLSSYVGLSGIETEEEFYDFVLEDYKKTIAVKKFIGDSADEEDLKDFYNNNYSDSLTVKHILIEVDSEAEDSDAADKEAYNKAVELINELKNTSAENLDSKFEELAENNSDDTDTYSNGGLIEDFTIADVQESFFNAAHELEDGEFTDEPVKTSYGYHVILKVSSTPVEEYKEIKEEVKNAYAQSLLSADSTLSVSKWAELRKQYKLSIKDDKIKEEYNTTIEEATNTSEE